jgi:hypothetical protein
MDRLLATLNAITDTAYVVFMAPGRWLASGLIEYSPSLAASLNIPADSSAGITPLILALLSWLIVALLVRILRYSLLNLARAITATFTRLRFRTLIAFHGLRTMFAGDSVDRRKDADGEAPSEGFKLNRLDLIVLNLAKTLGPGFALSAPELANRLNLRPHQIQESLEKLSRHSLIDHTTVTTDGYENYRLNNTGSYVLTMWEHHRARA